MPRLRTIKPGFFTNDLLAEVPPLGRLLFAGLWCHADREGRLEDRPKRLKVEILPYDDCDVDALLDALAQRGFVQRYTVDGTHYLAIPKFAAHQNPHVKEAPSIIPAPPAHSACLPINKDEHQASTVLAPDKPRSFRAVVGSGNLGVGSGLRSHPTTATQSPGEAPDAALAAPDAPRRRPAAATPSTSPPAPGPAPAPSVTALALTADSAARRVPKPDSMGAQQALWDVFDRELGRCRTQPERDRRGKACRLLREGHVTPEELTAAIQAWPNVMADATLTEMGVAGHIGSLLEGPQRHGRSNGVVQQHTQRLTEGAYVRRGPETGAILEQQRRQRLAREHASP